MKREIKIFRLGTPELGVVYVSNILKAYQVLTELKRNVKYSTITRQIKENGYWQGEKGDIIHKIIVQ